MQQFNQNLLINITMAEYHFILYIRFVISIFLLRETPCQKLIFLIHMERVVL